MKIDIQSHQLKLDKALRIYINRKLKFALSRVENTISSIVISFSKALVKSPLVDASQLSAKKVYLKITLHNLQILEYEDAQTDIYCAIDRVIQKACRAMARRLFLTGISAAK